MNRLENFAKWMITISAGRGIHPGLCSIAINGSNLLEETIPQLTPYQLHKTIKYAWIYRKV